MRQYSPRTEEAYVQWVRRYIFFHKLRHPAEMGTEEIQAFLSDLAVRGNVSASTQNQALCALIFLYRLLGKDIGVLGGLVRAKRPRRLPVVLTEEEVDQVFARLEGLVLLICRLLYGSGMRLLECLGMRVKDLDFQLNEITVRDGKGRKDRVTLLPATCAPALKDHLAEVQRLHDSDLRDGLGRTPLPDALARKVPERRSRVGLAVRLSRILPLHRPPHWRPAPPSPARERAPEGTVPGRPPRGPHQAGHASHAASFAPRS
jgi:integrase